MAFKDRIDPPMDEVDGCLDMGCMVVCIASSLALVCGGLWFVVGMVRILSR